MLQALFRWRLLTLCFAWSAWFGGANGAERPNVLLMCVDDLRPELKCYGRDYIQSPHIDALAARGRRFERHYVQAPTCGASRYALLTGRYGPSGNEALFARARQMASAEVPPSLPEWFRSKGYVTVSVGKVSHHPGGRGGPDWNDDSQPELPGAWNRHLLPAGRWQHPRGAMHGLAHGEIRVNGGDMDLFQSVEGTDEIYPDGLITEQALQELDGFAADPRQPFLLAVGLIRPHLPLGAPAKYMEPYVTATFPPIPHPQRPEGKTTWHGSGEFMKYNRNGRDPNTDVEYADLVRKHYAACVTYADAQVGRIMSRLTEHGLLDNTVIVLWGDHGWHLGEHAVWGKHTLFEESLRSPLLIAYHGIHSPGEPTHSIVESLDIFPTLCDLAQLPQPDFVHGISLRPILESPAAPGHAAVSYASAMTIRTDTHRLIVHPGGHTELYVHPGGETVNVSEVHPEVVAALKDQLNTRNALRLGKVAQTAQ